VISVTDINGICTHIAAVDNHFWNTRYGENETVYGKAPNEYFRQFIDSHKPGATLLPAEGEGRNAVYAVSKGWQVDAFDFSETAMEKALQMAKENGVMVNYWIQDLANYKAERKYDAIGLIYVHLPESIRKPFHEQAYKSLESGSFLVLEAFAKEQAQLESGGPRDKALLYDAPIICDDFPFLHLLSCGQKEVILNEGNFHRGKASVLRMIGQKL
jgi:hypothetical protein